MCIRVYIHIHIYKRNRNEHWTNGMIISKFRTLHQLGLIVDYWERFLDNYDHDDDDDDDYYYYYYY